MVAQKDTPERKATQRDRLVSRVTAIMASGGPVPPAALKGAGLDWYAANLERKSFLEVADKAECLGEIECLVASGNTTPGGMTVQLQVLPAYIHEALDLVQRSNQGVLIMVAFHVPWESFRMEGSPNWPQLTSGDEMPEDGDGEG